MLTLTIEMSSWWHVGTGEGAPDTDARTHRLAGRPAIPQTQVKDLIREHAAALAPTLGLAAAEVDAVFGRPGSATVQGEWQWASAVPLDPTSAPTVEISRHHRRDPDTGVVPRDGLFDLEVVAPCALGAIVGPRDGVPALVDHVVLVGLAAATVRRFGARRWRGLGRSRVTPVWSGDILGLGHVELGLADLVQHAPGLRTEVRA